MVATLSEMRIMDKVEGDITIGWNRKNKDEVSAAKKAFHTAKKKGMLMYKTKWDGKKGEQIHEFDPKAEKIIGMPALVGG